MILLQFSTSHYCRKARLALGYKQVPYKVENLAPGLHALRVQPLTGATTLPVLLPQGVKSQSTEAQSSDLPAAIGDSTRILKFLETYQPDPPLTFSDPAQNSQIWALEDWLDESIGVATRFVYYDYRANAGKQLDPSFSSQALIQVVRWQYGINQARVVLAVDRLNTALNFLSDRWQRESYLVGGCFTAADLTAAALLSPLARIPDYRAMYPWLFERIAEIHQRCQEPLPPGLSSE